MSNIVNDGHFFGGTFNFFEKIRVPPTFSKFFLWENFDFFLWKFRNFFRGTPKKIEILIFFLRKIVFFLGTPRKNIYKIRVFCRESVPRSPSARRGFQKPLGASGDLGTDSLKKTRISYTNSLKEPEIQLQIHQAGSRRSAAKSERGWNPTGWGAPASAHGFCVPAG